MPGMEKRADYILPYRGYFDPGGICRVRLYYPAEDEVEYRNPCVAILTDLPENDNTSVTNLIEVLCCEIALDRALPDGTLFVEHVAREYGDDNPANLPEGWSLVGFAPPGRDEVSGEAAGLPYRLARFGAGIGRPSFGSPTWSHTSFSEMERILADRDGSLLKWEPAPALPSFYKARREAKASRVEGERRASGGVVHEPALSPVFAPDTALRGIPDNVDEPVYDEEEVAVVLKRQTRLERPQARGEALTNVASSVSGGGHEWGYLGTGPSNLALDVLAALIPAGADGMPSVDAPGGPCSATAWRLRHPFKEQILARMPHEGGVISASRIWEWMATAFAAEDTSAKGIYPPHPEPPREEDVEEEG